MKTLLEKLEAIRKVTEDGLKRVEPVGSLEQIREILES